MPCIVMRCGARVFSKPRTASQHDLTMRRLCLNRPPLPALLHAATRQTAAGESASQVLKGALDGFGHVRLLPEQAAFLSRT